MSIFETSSGKLNGEYSTALNSVSLWNLAAVLLVRVPVNVFLA